MDKKVSIGTVKRDISALVNQVAYGGERIILTSRGKPKAVIVSIEDFEKLTEADTERKEARMEAWLAQAAEISRKILERRDGELIDVDRFLEMNRKDLEDRDDRFVRSD